MYNEKDQIEGSKVLKIISSEAEAYNLVDDIYTFIARSDIYTSEALSLAYNTLASELSKGGKDPEEQDLLQYIANYLYIKSGR